MKERKTGRNTGSMTGRKKERRRRATRGERGQGPPSLIKEGHVPPLRILVSPVGGGGARSPLCFAI